MSISVPELSTTSANPLEAGDKVLIVPTVNRKPCVRQRPASHLAAGMMGTDDKAIVATNSNEPAKEVDERTLVVAEATGPASEEVNDESGAVESRENSKAGEEEIAVGLRKKRPQNFICLWCCGITGFIVLVLVIILLILIFVVFKVKSPSLNVTSTTLEDVKFSKVYPVTFTTDININVTVHNPNVVGYKYGKTTVEVFYRGDQVAEAPVAAGEIKAKSSENVFLPARISLSSNDPFGNLFQDLVITEMLPLVSTVSLKGTVKIWGIKIKNIRISSVCDINYFLNNSTQSFSCHYNTKI